MLGRRDTHEAGRPCAAETWEAGRTCEMESLGWIETAGEDVDWLR